MIDTRVHGSVEIVGQDIFTIAVKNVPAGTLVPILRPRLPVSGHLAAAVCSNVLRIRRKMRGRILKPAML